VDDAFVCVVVSVGEQRTPLLRQSLRVDGKPMVLSRDIAAFAFGIRAGLIVASISVPGITIFFKRDFTDYCACVVSPTITDLSQSPFTRFINLQSGCLMSSLLSVFIRHRSLSFHSHVSLLNHSVCPCQESQQKDTTQTTNEIIKKNNRSLR
jgi:hypothetical protein